MLYILKSAVCIGFLYLTFRIFMSKDASFSLNRRILLAAVAASLLIPLINVPLLNTPVRFEVVPEFTRENIQPENQLVADLRDSDQSYTFTEKTGNELNIHPATIIKYTYLTGILIAFVLLVRNIISVLILMRKSTSIERDGYRLVVLDRDIPSFAFARSIVISRSDYENYGASILPHEKAHIRLNHFFDLMLLELVKIIHWFNPAIYGIIHSLKEIHEFQADAYTLHSGVDAGQYQLLIIKKSVGPKKFALANSFNHCQIKKRIVMMNKEKKRSTWRWKVWAFLPMTAVLLMAFGKGNVPESRAADENGAQLDVNVVAQDGQQTSDRVIRIKRDGNYVGNKKYSLEEIVNKGKVWQQESNDWILLEIDESVPFKRVDEVWYALTNANVYHITQSATGSDEIIYPAGDVGSMAKLKDGNWNDWINGELSELLKENGDSLGYIIQYGFVVDKYGKVRDGRVIRSSGKEEIDAAYQKVLSQIPDWKPAIRLGEAVSVFHTEMRWNRVKKEEKGKL